MDNILAMGAKLLNGVVGIFNILPFSGPSWFIIAILGFLVWIFAKASRNPTSKVDWEDLIIDTRTQRVTPYKLGYLIGMIVSTWITISLADANKLTFDIFGLYLSYLLGGAGWMAMVNKKGGGSADPVIPDAQPDVSTTASQPVVAPVVQPAPVAVPQSANNSANVVSNDVANSAPVAVSVTIDEVAKNPATPKMFAPPPEAK